MPRVLYLHGYRSQPLLVKTDVLARHLGEVVAPALDYDQGVDFAEMERLAQQADVLVGSSLGGLLAFHLSERLGRAALLFNPALHPAISGRYGQQVARTVQPRPAYRRVVLGRHDEQVPNETTFEYLNARPDADGHLESAASRLVFVQRDDLAHQIPLAIFEEEVRAFAAAYEG